MRYPQVMVYEQDGSLARMLRPMAEAHQWVLREPRRPEACLRLLRSGCPSVLLLQADRAPGEKVAHPQEDTAAEERRLGQSFTLLETIHWLFPGAASVVVGNHPDVALAGLAWDLGASYVLFPPLAREQLPEVVSGLMKGAMDRTLWRPKGTRSPTRKTRQD